MRRLVKIWITAVFLQMTIVECYSAVSANFTSGKKVDGKELYSVYKDGQLLRIEGDSAYVAKVNSDGTYGSWEYTDELKNIAPEGQISIGQQSGKMYYVKSGKLLTAKQKKNGKWVNDGGIELKGAAPERDKYKGSVLAYANWRYMPEDTVVILNPTINADEDMICFVSNMKNSDGLDIWKIEKDEDGNWGEPTKLDARVNGSSDENYPFFRPDGTLSFATNKKYLRTEPDKYDVYVVDVTSNDKPMDLAVAKKEDQRKEEIASLIQLANVQSASIEDSLSVEPVKTMTDQEFAQLKLLVNEQKVTNRLPKGITAEEMALLTQLSKTEQERRDYEAAHTFSTDELAELQRMIQNKKNYELSYNTPSATLEGDSVTVKVNANGLPVQVSGGLPSVQISGDSTLASVVTNGASAQVDGTLKSNVPMTKEEIALLEKFARLSNDSTQRQISSMSASDQKEIDDLIKIARGERLPQSTTEGGSDMIASSNGTVEAVAPLDSAKRADLNEKIGELLAKEESGKEVAYEDVRKVDEILKANPDTVVKVSKNVIATHEMRIFYFEYDSEIANGSYEEDMQVLLDFINAYPDSRFLLVGNTDERGAEEYNEVLSVKRAEWVRFRLLIEGVKLSRLEIRGDGERNPIIKNSQTEADHQKNRRVEVIRLK